MIRLYVPHDLKPGAAIGLDPEQSRYLAQVMRLGVGGAVEVFNGRDGAWRAAVASLGKRTVTLGVEALARPQAAGPDVELVVAMVKRGPLETIIEKACELGAARVRLVRTERTVADHARMERLCAIAVEACEQTGRLEVPEIVEPVKLDALLTGWDTGRRLMYCDEAGEAPPALKVLAGEGPWAILIGPEGGFSPAERTRIRSLSFVTAVSLGPRILRADTAAIAALTLWQAQLGDARG
jgi:16S rRNA (uracil1498-N3)-methyltransferase